MRISLSSPVEISIRPDETISQFRKRLKNIMEVAAIKALETAVERTPAAGETPYSTGQLRQSIRVQKVEDLEFELVVPRAYGIFLEFGTGPRGAATGRMPEFPNDPVIQYHSGEVLVTRHKGKLLEEPYIRRTQGMEAQPFLRPALLRGVEVIKELLDDSIDIKANVSTDNR